MKVLLRINQFLHQNLVAISINWKDLIYMILKMKYGNFYQLF